MSRPRVVLGVDPSMGGTGLALVVATPRGEMAQRRLYGPWSATCIWSATVKAPASSDRQTLLTRLVKLQERVMEALKDARTKLREHGYDPALPIEVCVEDPTDYKPAREQRSTQTAARLGAAAAAVMLAIQHWGAFDGTAEAVHVYGTQDWLPKESRGGRGGHRHPMRHELVVRWILGQVRGLAEAGVDDDQAMAAGVVLYHLTQTPEGPRT